MGMYCFGIDVGGTSVKCGLFLTNGTLVEQWEIPTRLENNGSSILPDVADAIKTKLDERGITKDNVLFISSMRTDLAQSSIHHVESSAHTTTGH